MKSLYYVSLYSSSIKEEWGKWFDSVCDAVCYAVSYRELYDKDDLDITLYKHADDDVSVLMVF